MARVPRALIVRSKFAVHKIWRGHNKEFNLGTDSEKARYLKYLNDDIEKNKTGSRLQALTLMGNHAHEIFRILNQLLFSGHMRRHHSRYGAYFNRKHRRCGKVAQDRPRTCLLGSPWHEMIAVFYIHANPLRARIVKDLKNYRWSTHLLYAYGLREEWMRNVVFPKWYLALGKTMKLRQKKYRSLFEKYLKSTQNRPEKIFKRFFFGPPLWRTRLEMRLLSWRNEQIPP